MEGLLSEFAAPSLTRKTHCRVRISLFPSQRQAHGTSVDIENSVALRATPVKARSKREAIVIDKTVIAPTPRWNAISNGRFGSWLRDNALTQPATLHVPVNVVRHGRSEQFFPVERSGTASESSWGMLGKVWLEIGTQWGLHTHALIAASTALVPTIFMTRVRL